MFGFYLVYHAHFAGLAVGIFVYAQIFLGHLVDVGAGAVFGNLDDAAADFEIAVGILGSIKVMATRGSRRTLRSFWRPLAELKMICSPS